MMFDSFEAYDVQETRRISRAEGKIEGKIEGRIATVITQTLKKLAKNYSVPEIADMLEEDEALIRCISDIKKAHPDSNEEEIWELLCKKRNYSEQIYAEPHISYETVQYVGASAHQRS